jgi:hypothetical protein
MTTATIVTSANNEASWSHGWNSASCRLACDNPNILLSYLLAPALVLEPGGNRGSDTNNNSTYQTSGSSNIRAKYHKILMASSGYYLHDTAIALASHSKLSYRIMYDP